MGGENMSKANYVVSYQWELFYIKSLTCTLTNYYGIFLFTSN